MYVETQIEHSLSHSSVSHTHTETHKHGLSLPSHTLSFTHAHNRTLPHTATACLQKIYDNHGFGVCEFHTLHKMVPISQRLFNHNKLSSSLDEHSVYSNLAMCEVSMYLNIFFVMCVLVYMLALRPSKQSVLRL